MIRGVLLMLGALAAPAERAPEWQALIDRAHNVPPEFAADALLRLAQSDRIPVDAKRRMIEDAYRLAGAAQQKLKRRAAEAGSAETRTQFQSRAYSQGLDTMSLQCRAVRLMLPLDKQKARELFGDMMPPRLPRVPCEDGLVYDVAEFYEALAEVAQSGFTAKERKEEEHVRLVASFVGSLTSPTQISPIANLLPNLKITPEQFKSLFYTFTGALKDLSGDDRSFTLAVSGGSGMAQSVERLAAVSRQHGVHPQPLLEAFRSFLVRHFSAARCAHLPIVFKLASASDGAKDTGMPDVVDFFNDKLQPLAPDSLRAITQEDIRPAKMEGDIREPALWDTPEAKQLAEGYRQFAADAGKGDAAEYLSAIVAWPAAQAHSPADSFRQKCFLLSNLVRLVPAGPQRENVLRSYLAFLKQNDFRQESPAEWFLPLNSLLHQVFGDRLSQRQILEEMKNSGDAVISLYASLEELLPRPPQLMGLL